MKSKLLDEIQKAAAAQKKATAPALEAARLRIAAAVAARRKPAKVQALPTPEGGRVDCSPYRKEFV